MRRDPETPRAGDASPAPLDLVAVRALGDLLDHQDLAAIDRARALGPALRATWGEARARELGDAIERLEFPRAVELLRAALGQVTTRGPS